MRSVNATFYILCSGIVLCKMILGFRPLTIHYRLNSYWVEKILTSRLMLATWLEFLYCTWACAGIFIVADLGSRIEDRSDSPRNWNQCLSIAVFTVYVVSHNNLLLRDFRANFTLNISDVLANENVTMSNVSYKEYFLLKWNRSEPPESPASLSPPSYHLSPFLRPPDLLTPPPESSHDSRSLLLMLSRNQIGRRLWIWDRNMQMWKHPLYFVRLMVCAGDKSYFDIHANARCFTHNLQRFISSLPVFCDSEAIKQAENDFIFRH